MLRATMCNRNIEIRKSGVHRVQRVPGTTETQGACAIFSGCIVAVLPGSRRFDVVINEADKSDTFRSWRCRRTECK